MRAEEKLRASSIRYASLLPLSFLILTPRYFPIDLLEIAGERDTEILVASCPTLRSDPAWAGEVHALDQNWNSLVCRPVLFALSQTGQGPFSFLS